MQLITAPEYASMKWNIKECASSVCKEFPELENRFVEFKKEKFEGNLTLDKVIRYIIFAYHIESPLVKKQIEVGVRKERALAEAGFERGDKDTIWATDIKEIINNDNEVVVRMICQFLKFEKNMRYSNLMFMYESYWNTSLSVVMYRTQMKDTALAMKATNDMTELMNKIEIEADKVFFGDKEIANQVSAIQVIERRFVISPEQVAGKAKNDKKELLKKLREKD